jgi:hypothetical protein
MAMRETGKGAPDPKLDAEEADELAASFKPAWDVEEPGEKTLAEEDVKTAVSPPPNGAKSTDPMPAPAIVASPVISIGNGASAVAAPAAPRPAADQLPSSVATTLGNPSLQDVAKKAAAAYDAAGPMRAPIESGEPLDADQVIEVAPAKAKAVASSADAATLPVGNKTPSVPPKAPPAAAKKPASSSKVAADPFKKAPVAIAAPADASDEYPVVKKSKNWIYIAVGLGIAIGVGGVVKFAMSDDPPPAKTATTATAAPPPPKEDIPPPPPKDEVTTPSTATVAAATTTAPAPAPEPSPAKDPVVAPTPPPRAAPVQPSRPAPVAAAPAPRPRPAPVSPPKTPTKSSGGGIVRDTPF